MFDFLKRKRTDISDVATPVVTDTSADVITPIAVYAFLVEAAKEIAIRSKELAVIERKSADDLREEYRELLSLGLAGTQNAKFLKERIDAVDAYNKNITKAEEIIAYIKRVNHCFGGRSFLVSKEKFREVCKKNKLSVGILTDYNGVIPERNIREIADAKKAFAEFYTNSDIPFIPFREREYNLYVKKVELEKNDFAPKIIRYLEENGNILPVRYIFSRSEIKVYSDKFLIDTSFDSPNHFTNVTGYAIDDSTFFIACPKKYLNNAEVEISRTPVDPVVFQYCPYGVLVHSVWGEEAEDKVLREYMEFNKLI